MGKGARRSQAAKMAWLSRRLRVAAPAPERDMEAVAALAAVRATRRAEARGIACDEALPDLVRRLYREQGGRCALSGIAFSDAVHGRGAAPRPFLPSIDRIDSQCGYVAAMSGSSAGQLIAFATSGATESPSCSPGA